MMSFYLSDLGVICSLGNGKAEVAQALFQNSPSAKMSSWPLLSGQEVPVARVSCEPPELPIEYKHLNSRNNRLLKVALDEIKTSVQAAKAKYGNARIGVVMASSTSGMYEEEKAFKHKFDKGEMPEDYFYAQYEMSSPSIFASQYFDLAGPAYTISTACSSGGKAICAAKRLIQSGICDVVIAGGVDTLCHLTLNGFHALELLSKTQCNPLSKNRNGITIGEGAAVFLVTAEKSPIELAGCGESSDAYHISCPEPTGAGAELAINEALSMASLKPEDICYINLHGTGTALNDAMESVSIHRIFGADLPCSSTKALTGHALGASASLELAFLWLALAQENNRTVPIPAHIWDGQEDPALPAIRLALPEERVSPINGGYAMMSNSFAFGGSNVSLILKKQPRPNDAVVDLLPHDPPMVLVDSVLAFDAEFIHAQVTIQPHSPFCEEGAVPAYVAIEYMAQTVGVWNGLMAKAHNQSPKIGFLLGSRRLDLKVPNFKVGQVLDIYGQSQYIDGEMASFDCWIEVDRERVAQAGLNVYQPKDINEFTKVMDNDSK